MLELYHTIACTTFFHTVQVVPPVGALLACCQGNFTNGKVTAEGTPEFILG